MKILEEIFKVILFIALIGFILMGVVEYHKKQNRIHNNSIGK